MSASPCSTITGPKVMHADIASRIRLDELPVEILTAILDVLSWPSLTALRQSNTFFAYSLIPSSSLSAHHNIRQQQTWDAERHHLQSTLGYANPNWTGFTQGWGLSRILSLSPTLPCYHCLRWLPSADATLSTSAFSRGMATKERDLGMEWAASRVCVDCGVRSGLYVKGNRVRHQIVCYGCGKLGEQMRNKDDKVNKDQYRAGLWKGKLYRWRHFCGVCVEAGRLPDTWLEFEHERNWGRYERGMEEGKMYRLEKGRRLRAEKGIVNPQEICGGQEKAQAVVPKRTCPVLEQKRICPCWKYDPKKSYELYWVRDVKSSLYVW